jgi:hypothetical protein
LGGKVFQHQLDHFFAFSSNACAWGRNGVAEEVHKTPLELVGGVETAVFCAIFLLVWFGQCFGQCFELCFERCLNGESAMF